MRHPSSPPAPLPSPGSFGPVCLSDPSLGSPGGIQPCSQFSWWGNGGKGHIPAQSAPAQRATLPTHTLPHWGNLGPAFPSGTFPHFGGKLQQGVGISPHFYSTWQRQTWGRGCHSPERTGPLFFFLLTCWTEVSCTLSSYHHISGVGRYFWTQSSSLGSIDAFTKPCLPWPQGDWSLGPCCPEGLGLWGEHVGRRWGRRRRGGEAHPDLS